MDADFSVRKEVESIRPPHAEDFVYEHEACPYDDIVEGIQTAPPFPAAPISSMSPQNPYSFNPYESVLRQQAWLIKQQQDTIIQLIESSRPINGLSWKYVILGLGIMVFLLYMRNPRRRNPRFTQVPHFTDDFIDYD